MENVADVDPNKEIKEVLINTIENIKKTKYDRSLINDDTFLGGDLGIDSIQLLETLHDIQKHFGIKIQEDQIGELYTIGDAVSMVAKYRNNE